MYLLVKMKSEYDIQAEKFLDDNGMILTFSFMGRKKPKWGETHVNTYEVKICKGGRKSFFSPFYDSIHNTTRGLKIIPTAYDFLACISGTYYNEDFNDFCDCYGYDNDSIKAFKTWKDVNEEAQKMEAFFTPEELTELREIN